MRRINQVLLLVGVVALAWMAWRLGPAALAAGVARSGAALPIAALCHLASLLCDALALKLGAGAPGRALPYRRFAYVSACGHAVNQATPLGALGELTKVTLLEENLAPRDAIGAVLMANFIMFLSNCLVLGAGTPVAALLLGLRGPILTAVLAASAVYAVLALGTIVVMVRGLGRWPFALARRLRLGAARVDRAEARWREIETSWKASAADRPRVAAAILSSVVGRLWNVIEAAVVLSVLGHDHVLWVAYLIFASSQLVAWTTSFIPMQAGTAEGGNALLFRSIGLAARDGVVLSLILRLRQLLFIALGLALLGRRAFARMTRTPAPAPAPKPESAP